jgi:hypothetical protein
VINLYGGDVSMRSFIVAIAATSVIVCAASTAEAQIPTSLMLSCTGTLNDGLLNKVDKVRIGVLLNFQTMQVVGLGYGWEANIDKVNETLVAFHRYSSNELKNMVLINGTVDRITGSLMANVVVTSSQDSSTIISVSYDLLCKPAQRLF